MGKGATTGKFCNKICRNQDIETNCKLIILVVQDIENAQNAKVLVKSNFDIVNCKK